MIRFIIIIYNYIIDNSKICKCVLKIFEDCKIYLQIFKRVLNLFGKHIQAFRYTSVEYYYLLETELQIGVIGSIVLETLDCVIGKNN